MQGLASFPGLPDISAASITFSTGITPSVATVQLPPIAGLRAQAGDLIFSFSGDEVRFKDCVIDQPSLRIAEGGQLWTLRILDRRWKWQFGKIEGRYNVRKASGEIEKDTEKTPQELAKLLLEAMNEAGFRVNRMPNEARPFKVWRSANPAQELANLCDELNCRPVLGLDDKVEIWPLNQGRKLPENGLEMNAGFGLDTKQIPDSIEVNCGETKIQSKLTLEAVGIETDGKIKKVGDLSYKPDDGWANQSPYHFAGVNAEYQQDGKQLKARDLALQSVWRMYRVKEQASGGLAIPGSKEQIKSVDQYFPLDNVLNETEKGDDNVERDKPAFVEGVFDSGDPGPVEEDANLNTAAGTIYPGDFSIDTERGLVLFSEPVFKLNADSAHADAELYLTTSYGVIDPDTRNRNRFNVEKKLGGKNDTGPMILNHPEIQLKVIVRYDANNNVNQVLTNRRKVEQEAEHYLDAAEKALRPEPSTDIQYAGIVPISPDGAIQQVSFKVGRGPAVTRASRNIEFDLNVPSYKERRRREKVAELAREAENAKK